MDESRRQDPPINISDPDDLTGMTALIEIGRSITSKTDPKSAATQILTQALALLGAEAGFLRLAPPAPGALPWTMAVGDQGALLPQPAPVVLGKGLVGLVAQAGQAMTVAHVQDEPRWDPALDGLEGIVARQALLAPVAGGDGPAGVLGVLNRRDERSFDARDALWLEFLAGQMAIVIERASVGERISAAEKAQSEMLDFVAHELRQPMTAMQGYAKMLSMGIGGELTPTQKQFVGVIQANVERMGQLVNDLLDISRLDAGRTQVHRTPVLLGPIVRDAVELCRSEIDKRRHTVIVEAPEDLAPVLGNQERLEQVTASLVRNAAMYTPDGGTIRVTVDHPVATHLRVSVQDTGIGLSPEELAKLENRFFRAGHDMVKQQAGSGLGLTIARKILEIHGGELQVESEPNRGSTFRFTVPLAPGS